MTDVSYQDVLDLLHERGVDDAGAVVTPYEDLDAVRGAIAVWDSKHGGKTTGLLVKMIRDGGKPGYRPPHKRTPAHRGDSPHPPRGARSADEWEQIYRRLLPGPGEHPVEDMCWSDAECRRMATERAGQRW